MQLQDEFITYKTT